MQKPIKMSTSENNNINNNHINTSNIILNALKNSETAINMTTTVLSKNDELQDKVLQYIINNKKAEEALKILKDYIDQEYPDDRIMTNILDKLNNVINNKSSKEDAKNIKEIIRTISKISSGIKEYKGDPDLWYHLKDQLVSIKIC